MVYHSAKLGPTQGQLMDLASGEEVKLGPHHLSGDVPFKLTTAQLKKIQAAAAAGRGCTLRLSKAQIQHNAKHGSGFLSDLIGSIGLGVHGGSVVGDLAREGYQAVVKPALKGVGRSAVGFVADKGAQLAKRAVDKVKNVAQDKLESLFGLKGSGLFHGTRCSPAQFQTLSHLEEKHGSGFLSSLLGTFGLGVHPGKTLAQQHGAGWIGSILKKVAHGGVDLLGNALGAGVHPHGGSIKSFLGKAARKAAHGAVDLVADTFGGNVRPNPLANPNEGLQAALNQKKIRVGGQGLYLPGGRGLYLP